MNDGRTSAPGCGERWRAPAAWWTDPAFWEEAFDFIFPPEHLALGEQVAAGAAALLAVAPPGAVLDLGCGPGRVCVPLARRGFEVVGVDAQGGYLARARDRAAREGARVELVQRDMRFLPFRGRFDAAISIFTSFGYFADRSDDERVLRGVHRALRPGGRFLLETAHRDGVVRLLGPRESEAPGGRRCREEPRFDPVEGVVEARWTITSPGGARTFTTRMRPYAATELDAMLRRAGFADVRFFGGLEGGLPSVDRFTLVAVATRGAR